MMSDYFLIILNYIWTNSFITHKSDFKQVTENKFKIPCY